MPNVANAAPQAQPRPGTGAGARIAQARGQAKDATPWERPCPGHDLVYLTPTAKTPGRCSKCSRQHGITFECAPCQYSLCENCAAASQGDEKKTQDAIDLAFKGFPTDSPTLVVHYGPETIPVQLQCTVCSGSGTWESEGYPCSGEDHEPAESCGQCPCWMHKDYTRWSDDDECYVNDFREVITEFTQYCDNGSVPASYRFDCSEHASKEVIEMQQQELQDMFADAESGERTMVYILITDSTDANQLDATDAIIEQLAEAPARHLMYLTVVFLQMKHMKKGKQGNFSRRKLVNEWIVLAEGTQLSWHLPLIMANRARMEEEHARIQGLYDAAWKVCAKSQQFYLTRSGHFPSKEFAEESNDLVGGFVCVAELGCGSHGAVFKATRNSPSGDPIVDETGAEKLYAVKIIERSKLLTVNALQPITSEVGTLMALQHPHIVRLECKFLSANLVHVVMECVGRRHLHDELMARENQCFDEKQARQLMWELTDATAYMHYNSFCHRDLKPENVAWVEPTPSHPLGKAVVLDFGLAHPCKAGEKLRRACGTVPFCSPQILYRREYDGFKNDCWSLGVIGLEVLLAPGILHDSIQIPMELCGRPSDELASMVEEHFNEPRAVEFMFQGDHPAHKYIRSALRVDEQKRFDCHALLTKSGWFRLRPDQKEQDYQKNAAP